MNYTAWTHPRKDTLPKWNKTELSENGSLALPWPAGQVLYFNRDFEIRMFDQTCGETCFQYAGDFVWGWRFYGCVDRVQELYNYSSLTYPHLTKLARDGNLIDSQPVTQECSFQEAICCRVSAEPPGTRSTKVPLHLPRKQSVATVEKNKMNVIKTILIFWHNIKFCYRNPKTCDENENFGLKNRAFLLAEPFFSFKFCKKNSLSVNCGSSFFHKYP